MAHGPDDLAHRVVRASSAPLLLLDHDLRVIAASSGYHRTFAEDADPEGRPLAEITGGAWMESHLQSLLDHVRLGEPGAVISATVVCPQGERQVRVDVEPTLPRMGKDDPIVLTIEDRTEAVIRDTRLEETVALLHDAQHRIANNLAMISSILSMKARSVSSEETRRELEAARRRILAMATNERHLQLTGPDTPTAMRPYLQALCRQLSDSLIGDPGQPTIVLRAAPGSQPRRTAVMIGLVVTELIINALKHAYPHGKNGRILVEYDEARDGWSAAVSDEGCGLDDNDHRPRNGLEIVAGIAAQLNAELRVSNTNQGLRVELCHPPAPTE